MKTNVKRTLVIVCAAVLIIGIMAAVISTGQALTNVIEKNKKKLTPFGGTTVYDMDFSEPFTIVTDTTGFDTYESVSSDGEQQYYMVYPKDNIQIFTTDGEDGCLKFVHDGTFQSTTTSPDPFVIVNGFTTLNMSDYKTLMIDFDFDATNYGESRYCNFRPSFLNASGSSAALTVSPLRYMIDGNGSYFVNSVNNVYYYWNSKSFHMTMLIDYTNYLTHYYVDGIYLDSIAIPTDAVSVRGARISIGYSLSSNDESVYTVDNVSLNVFEKNYEGAIDNLLADHKIKLQDNTDTVLGGSYHEE